MSQISIEPQFSVFLVNKPGVLAQVMESLAKEKINLVAITLVDSQEHGVVRFVAEDPAATRAVLVQLNLPMTETEILRMEVSNRPGALAQIASKLGENHVNINYAYCTSGAKGGKTTAILKVADLVKAQRVLKVDEPKTAEEPRKNFMPRRK